MEVLGEGKGGLIKVFGCEECGMWSVCLKGSLAFYIDLEVEHILDVYFLSKHMLNGLEIVVSVIRRRSVSIACQGRGQARTDDASQKV